MTKGFGVRGRAKESGWEVRGLGFRELSVDGDGDLKGRRVNLRVSGCLHAGREWRSVSAFGHGSFEHQDQWTRGIPPASGQSGGGEWHGVGTEY